jgi:hypothetical protein
MTAVSSNYARFERVAIAAIGQHVQRAALLPFAQ